MSFAYCPICGEPWVGHLTTCNPERIRSFAAKSGSGAMITETERLRGFPDAELPKLTDIQLIMLSIAIAFEVRGIDDRPLVEELFKRGREVS